mmetsp:Transcript_32470/g.107365  ORF Transcript_32470/g.107365 Transcript_32470/m.107365 type:complete len:279 (-) Transcript_32470:1558-2394(-)
MPAQQDPQLRLLARATRRPCHDCARRRPRHLLAPPLLLPRVQDGVHRLGRREVAVDQVEHELGRVGGGRQRVAEPLEMAAHLRGGAEVGDAARREDEHVVEALVDGGGRLVDRAQDRDVGLLGRHLEEVHDLGGGRRVEPRRRLVQEDHRRLLGQRDREREAPPLPRGESGHESAACPRVPASREAGGLEQLRDLGTAALARQRGAVQVDRVPQVVARRQKRPVVLGVADDGAVAREAVRREGLPVECHAAARGARASLEREHREQGRLAGAGRAEHG